jgi:hypothetical protein
MLGLFTIRLQRVNVLAGTVPPAHAHLWLRASSAIMAFWKSHS